MVEVTVGRGGDGAVPRPMLTVAAVARRLGVAPATLRTWDRRYGLGPSEHTAGSHRRYSGVDVARLMVMRRLTLEGVPPSEAARIARVSDVREDAGLASVTTLAARPVPVGGPASVTAGTDAATARETRPDGEDRVDVRVAQAVAEELAAGLGDEPDGLDEVDLHDAGRVRRASRAGGGQVVSLPDGTPAARGLARAAMALDSHECMRLVRQHVERHGTVSTWDHLIAPVLVAVGERWRTTGTGVEVEHVLSESILSSLRTVSAGLRHPVNSRPVLLAAAEQEQHGLPLHVLTAALAEQGVSSRLLGVRVPRTALAAAIRRSGPAVVFVYAHLRVADPEQLDGLPRLRPSPLILLGGPGWSGVDTPPGAERVDDLGGATARIASAVGV
ncbi:MerR family transcriptional regulator [Aquipuribacter sp. MA13-6]|uniref:MerR family transcriptional regulator n=1 Tax=unclassified Aquipuribacter TaxID=2635084 RepID=UPI003EE96FEA